MGADRALKIAKQVALVILIIGALATLGFFINQSLDNRWIELVYIMRIFREIISLGDMFIDTTLLISFIGTAIALNVAYWSVKGIIFVVSYFSRD